MQAVNHRYEDTVMKNVTGTDEKFYTVGIN